MTSIRLLLLVVVGSSLLLTSCNQRLNTKPEDDLPYQTQGVDKSDFSYRDHYGLKNVNAKLVDNRGNGYEELYGVRNFRVVIHGAFYRGGANNHYHREHKRDNRNPLPEDGLQNLCEEGFGTAIYLYGTNFSSASPVTHCNSIRQPSHKLDYQQVSPYNSKSIYKILQLVHASILEPSRGPVYAHCWNGWHASGLISAYALRQFCSLTGEQAVQYWDRNTDGSNTDPNFEKLRQEIRKFKPFTDLLIPADMQKQLCPALS